MTKLVEKIKLAIRIKFGWFTVNEVLRALETFEMLKEDEDYRDCIKVLGFADEVRRDDLSSGQADSWIEYVSCNDYE